MPRKPLYRTNFLPYHVTARSNNREEFPILIDRLWTIVGNECLFLNLIYEVEFHAIVLMPNHFHMILTVPKHDVGIVMNELMRSVSRRTNSSSGRSGHLFGGSYHWSLIGNSRYYGHAIKYVYRNPVRAKLCKHVEDYPYSSLQGHLGMSHLAVPLYFTRSMLDLGLIMNNDYLDLEWLNTPFPSEVESLIQKGLRKRLFDNLMDRKTRLPIEALSTRL